MRLTRAILVVCAVASAFNVADLATTYFGLLAGLKEGNPSAHYILEIGQIQAYASIKVLYSASILCVGILFDQIRQRQPTLVYTVVLIMLSCLTIYFGVTLMGNLRLLIH